MLCRVATKTDGHQRLVVPWAFVMCVDFLGGTAADARPADHQAFACLLVLVRSVHTDSWLIFQVTPAFTGVPPFGGLGHDPASFL
ncbi:MAG: hypothetical protein A2Y61_00185 [Chloroflexi bacterium RBG_13_60_13]|nr:MAG: hypothetical protein A2Y61_00185 [Chloroflexi bacterium RBG_13_60_13]